MNKKKTEITDMDFEQAYAELKAAVEKLENPNLSIEESIELYERACTLALSCKKALDKAKLKITDINERIEKLKNDNIEETL